MKGLTASTSSPSLASTLGIAKRGGAVRVVDDDLELRGADALDVDGGLERGGVVLEGSRRETDVADLAGEHPSEVLTVEETLDLALRVLGDVESVWIEEADDDRLWIAGHESNREPAAHRPGDE